MDNGLGLHGENDIIAAPGNEVPPVNPDGAVDPISVSSRISINGNWASTLKIASAEVVNRIYEIKGHKHTSPLAICVGDVHDIQGYAVTDHLPHGLLDCLLPGPITMVLRRGESSILEKSLNPGLESIGIRVPDYNFIRVIARGSRSALALTSANLSGQPSSINIKDFENLWENCAYVYDGGILPAGRARSKVVDLTKLGKYKILRPGR
ncbi:uncharacterized protein LOC142161928 [Nicotiana tabacum]|uniref:Uncharacterized protein LOC142161928 n=1 Tax=Nicotiana tabacum TaxID=4097 RepID=A0AC58RNB1_TOBAC